MPLTNKSDLLLSTSPSHVGQSTPSARAGATTGEVLNTSQHNAITVTEL